MNNPLPFLTILFICSCGQQEEKKASTQNNVANSDDSLRNIASSTNNDTDQIITDENFTEWKKHEDSLRSEILSNKENKILKLSFLQELYIRNVAIVAKDSLFVSIPFDLHGPDCGAPDCYTTDISFSFKLGTALIFPKKLMYQEVEHGCVEKAGKLSDSFQLFEQTDNYVIYHSSKYKRTLVLFRSNKESGAFAFYFENASQNRINGTNVNKFVKEYNDELKNSIYPFTSWILSTNEYEHFLH